ncbi:gamma-glutamyltransferase family protein [Phytoactinopolyspora limicola]|uniref:gamma-glutamyltransferase family protein n=1 Tax=Phytoactinopolyspora limicola TaxID=2715536 RepID=UPI00140B4C70|nr:gamma-glutamyltransferase family protein [Phytoactinopolyspora limicola]
MPPFTTRPEITGTFGMVASTHWLASQTGMAVLERGGNAFDAAVAAGFVLQVVEPELNGPGGEVPVMGWDSRWERPFVVCGQGTAPAAAEPTTFRTLGHRLVPGTGLLPACVPGAFDGWMTLLQRYGTMRLGDVLQYAVYYASHGFSLAPATALAIDRAAPWFRAHWPTSAEVWLRNDGPPRSGSRISNPQLAATYRRIVHAAEMASTDRDEQIDVARRTFYEGFVAEAIATFMTAEVMDSSMRRHRGLLSYADLAGWRATIEDPVTRDYHGYTVCKPGPWTQGPVFLQQLALLDGFDLATLDPAGPELAHVVIECAKLAFADREAFYGDPDFVDVPITELLTSRYAAARRALVGEAADVGPLRPGYPAGRVPRLSGAPSSTTAFSTTVGRGSTLSNTETDTSHVDVADRHGNMVSATPSGGWLQSSPAVPGLGFCLGTRAQTFWLDDGLPNTVAPGKRPRITLSPSLVLRGGRPYLCFGTPGGDRQDQWSLLFFLRHVHHHMNLQEAIDAPTWHTTHFPSSSHPRHAEPGRVHMEDRVGDAVIASLRRRGHDIVVDGPWSLGRLTAVSRAADDMLRAGADPRTMRSYACGR